ncbi:hypothetical protein GQ602_002134 [Ophiocordyceps camponoti-floridani]|uniref:Uncharacterized protein n=1 Tax=Ophiocordyceps camponoti-floridani TaxID=2030778 RepID=A0A8H4VF05_9HYPO|nr:hypothetical protein GQ602_002134 [Ophiocordyceps camponoti-floridani]
MLPAAAIPTRTLGHSRHPEEALDRPVTPAITQQSRPPCKNLSKPRPLQRCLWTRATVPPSTAHLSVSSPSLRAILGCLCLRLRDLSRPIRATADREPLDVAPESSLSYAKNQPSETCPAHNDDDHRYPSFDLLARCDRICVLSSILYRLFLSLSAWLAPNLYLLCL